MEDFVTRRFQPEDNSKGISDNLVKRIWMECDPVNEVHRGQELEYLISEISENLAYLPSDAVDQGIEEGLQEIIRLLEVDSAGLFQQKEPGVKKLVLTHSRARNGDPGANERLLNSINELFSNVEAIDLVRKDLSKDDVNGNSQDCKLKHSAIAVPLFDGTHIFGILAVGAAKQMEWAEDLYSKLRLAALVFSTALIRVKTEQKIRQTEEELRQARIQLKRQSTYLREPTTVKRPPANIIYQSNRMREILVKAQQVASTNASVLLYGETGTGKELIAFAVHEMSSRSSRPMVRVNCGAIPAALIESEMFGREKGAYSGALSIQIGRFELANSSTIFLDEITELPIETQVKLLRVLQEKQIERLGNPRPINVDVRVIAATNQSIEKAVEDGKFRQDLYYRLNVFPISLPPLRERPEDIPMLVWSFVDELSKEFGKKVESIPAECMNVLMEYPWPGNVRELRNTIERAMIVCNSPTLEFESPKPSSSSSAADGGTNLTLRVFEIHHIKRVLENSGWKIRGRNGAAEILGMKPTTLETRMAKLGITRPKQ